MRSIEEAATQEMLDELSEVLDKCKSCDCLATLKKFIPRSDGELNHVDSEQSLCEYVQSLVYLNNGYVYVSLKSGSTAELNRIKSLWEITLQRGTQKTLENQDNDYALVIDLIKQELESSLVYTLSFIQPVFMAFEDGSLFMVFETDNMFFGKETVTLAEIEYAEEIEKDRYEPLDGEDVQDGENSILDAEQFIGTDKFIS